MPSTDFKYNTHDLITEQVKRVENETRRLKNELDSHEAQVKKLTKQLSALALTHAQLKDVQLALSGLCLGSLSKITTANMFELVGNNEQIGAYDRTALRSGLRNLSNKRKERDIQIKPTKRKKLSNPDLIDMANCSLKPPLSTPARKTGPIPNTSLPNCAIIVDNLKGTYVELCCNVCHVNSTAKGEFFKGWAGLYAHLTWTHDTSDKQDEETGFDYIMRTCVIRELQEFELEDLQSGKTTIKNVSEPVENKHNKVIDQTLKAPTVHLPYGPAPELGPPLDEPEPVLEVPTWCHADGTGEHSLCSVCEEQLRPGGAARICRFCGWGICVPCFIYRQQNVAHFGVACMNSMGDIEHFDLRQF